MTRITKTIWRPLAVATLLSVAFGPTAVAASGEGDDLAQLEQLFDLAVQEFMQQYQAAEEAERQAMLEDPRREPRQRFTPLFLAAARRRAGTAGALPGWVWLAEHGAIADRSVGDLAVERLLTEHLASPELAPAAKAIRRSAGVRGAERAVADLGVIVDGTPFPAVRAAALLQRGLLRRQVEDPGELAAARDDLERALRLATAESIAGAARDALADLGALAPGTEAPPIVGTGVRGEPIDSRQLRGRVVLVAFWGMWCGPCLAELPELDRLAARLRDRPFTLLGVNSDPQPAAVRRFLDRQGIRWPSVADRSTDGPVAAAWHVTAWPASYLVDPQGKIRVRDPSPAAVEELVDDLAAALGEERNAASTERR